MTFKFHNISLPGQFRATINPSKPRFNMEQDCWNTLDFLKKSYPHEYRRNIHIVDLGALEGGYAVELYRLGFNVTIIEARKENVEKCQWVIDQLGYRIRVIHDDAKNLYKYGPFDVVLCLGILYHFDKPAAFLEMAARVTKRLLVINTHYVHLKDPRYDQAAWKTRIGLFFAKHLSKLHAKHHHNLSKISYNEGYVGRWYKEYPEKATSKEIEKSREAAFSNPRSFWLMKSGLEHAALNAGFLQFYELHDKKNQDRAIFICFK